MDSDLDPFDNILPEPAAAPARAGGKFQPRAKPRASKVTSTSLSSVLPSNAREKSVSSFPTTLDNTKPVQSDKLTISVGSSLVLSSRLLESEGDLENHENSLQCEPVNSSTQTVERKEDLSSPDSLPSGFVVTNSKQNGDPSFLLTEADSTRLDLDPFAVIVPDTAVNKEENPQMTEETVASKTLKLSDDSNDLFIAIIPTGSDESLHSTDVSGNRSRVSVSLPLTTSVVAREPQKDDGQLPSPEKGNLVASSLLPGRAENVGSVDARDLEAASLDGTGEWNSNLEKSVADVGSLEFDLDPPNIVVPECHASDSQSVESFITMDQVVEPFCPSLPHMDNENKEPLKENEVLSPHDNTKFELVNSSLKELMPKENSGPKDAHLAVVNSLGLDLDPFVDIFLPPAISNVRAGGKFQPRGKARPRKVTPESHSFAVSGATVEGPAIVVSTVSDKLQSAKVIDVGDSRLMDSVYSTLTTMESKETLRNDDCTNSGVLSFNVDRSAELENSSHLVASDAQHLGVIDRDSHSGFAKAIGENVDIFSGLEYIHDFVTQTPRTEVPLPASNDGTQKLSRFPAQISVNSSALGACSETTQNPITCNEATVQIDNRKSKSDFQELGSFADFECPGILSESAIALECCTRNTQPEPMVQNGQGKTSTGILPDVPATNSQIDPSDTVYIDSCSIPTFRSEDVLDYSSMSFSNFIPTDPTGPEFPMNEGQINPVEASCCIDRNILHQEDLPGVHAKGSKDKKRKSSSASNLAQNSKRSSLVGEKNLHDGFPSEPPNSSTAYGDIDYDYRVQEDNDIERVENAASDKRASNRSKQPSAEHEKKPVSRRKRNNGALEQSTQQSRKKFCHSTRRKNRLKDLLSIPEDEIDFQKMPFKDIILLAGYKENLAIKEAKASKTASANKSTTDSFHGEDYDNEEDTITSEQDGGCINDQSNSLFNHHSFMDKTPTARWSKQETEMFYEGIRQFGTDLSMIQQLFPSRTRHQIKLKYKKEERQHPLRLSEALNGRAKDHSYFEKVIEQLQQVAAEAEQESNRGNSVSLTDDEDAELNLETNEEVAKFDEQDEDATVEDKDGDPLKYDEDDDDFDIWSSYKSEF